MSYLWQGFLLKKKYIMGLDMNLKRIQRTIFESVEREDFWKIELENSEDLICWRKKDDINQWFFENTFIIEECSDELTKEKLEKLLHWLLINELKKDAENIKKIISENNFIENVIYYSYCN